MSNILVKRLEISTSKTNNNKDLNELLKEFINKNKENITFTELDRENLREKLWKILFNLINKTGQDEIRLLCLTCVKLLCREKSDLDKLITEDRLISLLNCAELLNSNKTSSNINSVNKFEYNTKKSLIIIESLMCLCNLVYNHAGAAQTLHTYDIATKLCNRMKQYSNDKLVSYEIKLFDMKFMFLLTALCEPARITLYENGNALKFFIEILRDELRKGKRTRKSSSSSCGSSSGCGNNAAEAEYCRSGGAYYTLSLEQFKYCCELLKTLFNILMPVKMENVMSQKELVQVLRDLLLADTANSKDLGLHGHVINLLTLMQLKVLNELIVPGYEVKKSNLKNNPGLLAVSKIVHYLDVMLSEIEGRSPIETLSPVLLVLLHLAQTNSLFRKYVKMEVLPNLREVHKRPEEGDSLRNRLCRLLTSPMDSVREPVADLLFTLCREDVGRMVKYTGYGNSAGLFARRGLSNGPLSYSSDSDSDTEEYSKHKDDIDPVLGCLPGPKDHSIEEMTEEQKEYLAVELANKIDKLQRGGVIQPCSIGADGKPEPIEHVLQLQMQTKLNLSASNGS